MLRQWIQLLPQHLSNSWMGVAALGTIAGFVLWVAGARFSRLLIGLAAVSAGGAIGLALPRYMNWNISGSGPAVALALVAGVLGYVMQRLWVAAFLGLVLAGWALCVTCVSCRSPEAMHVTFASPAQWWNSLPPNVAAWIPWTCGSAMVIGFVLALIWPRLGIAAAWSTAGVSLLAALGTAIVATDRPQWIGRLPQQLGPQLATVLCLVGIGVLMQWKTAGRLTGRFTGGFTGGFTGHLAGQRFAPSPATSQGD